MALAGDRLGDRATTRRNARLILRARGDDPSRLDACFGVPRVVACVGHLIDRPDRPQPRFPPALEAHARAALADRLRAVDAGIGYACAACGADILALECLRDRGAETHIVLPFRREEFERDSVDIVPGGDWAERFDRVLASAADVVVASEHRLGRGPASYEYAFRLLDGLAAVRADELDTELVGVALWNGEAGDGAGGTAAAVDHWRRLGRTVEVVDLAALLRDHGGAIDLSTPRTRPAAGTTSRAPEADAFDPRVVALLFADVAGFSQLGDTQLPRFVEHYLGLVARELGALAEPPLLANTWGDGLYIVFGRIADAAAFALKTCAAIRATDWPALGLPASLELRVGLHAGPAYACLDPVTRRPGFFGAHVSRAARIEPVTPPGAVYASQPFAALARADGATGFTCTYVGPMPLAKGYGTFPTYVVRPR
jgi:class 3 adenylate cyclase